MPRALQTTLEPRKSPVQARSTASVEAILKATIQVLLRFGKERLTTSRVAARAGVSVGTLYQYFPNKSALLRAALQRHMDEVVQALETVCREQAGASLETMATAIVTGFLEAKMRNVKASLALYAVSSDIDGARIAREAGLRANRSIVALLATARTSSPPIRSWLPPCSRQPWPESAAACSSRPPRKPTTGNCGMNWPSSQAVISAPAQDPATRRRSHHGVRSDRRQARLHWSFSYDRRPQRTSR